MENERFYFWELDEKTGDIEKFICVEGSAEDIFAKSTNDGHRIMFNRWDLADDPTCVISDKDYSDDYVRNIFKEAHSHELESVSKRYFELKSIIGKL